MVAHESGAVAPQRAERAEVHALRGRRRASTGSRVWALLLALLFACSVLPAAAQEPVPDPLADPLAGPDATTKVYLPRVLTRPVACLCMASALDALPNRAPIPGEYLVTLRDAGDRAAMAPNGLVEPLAIFAQQAVAALGGSLLATYDSVEIFSAQLSEEGAALLARDPNVLAVEPNRILRLNDFETPRVVPFSAQVEGSPALSPEAAAAIAAMPDVVAAVPPWGLDRSDQRNLPLDFTFTPYNSGSKVHVYIIDTGIQWTNPQLAGRIGASYTAVGDGNGWYDCQGHGTHVAGTAGGGSYGVARNVVLHAVRVLDACGNGSDEQVVAGVDWVKKNAIKPAVANMSLGGEGVSVAINSAVAGAIAAGITFVVAAGNDGTPACDYSPASAPAAITVGASDRFDFNAAFSNFGSCVDIYAPGVDILSSIPGTSPLQSKNAVWDGTSMAAPHVAGAAALYLSSVPGATPAAVANILRASSSTNRLWYLRGASPNRLAFTANTGASPAAPARPAALPCTNLIANGGFETTASWSESSSAGYALICRTSSCQNYFKPGRGAGMAWLGGAVYESSYIWQDLVIPAGKPATLSYWYLAQSVESSCAYDRGYAGVFVGSTELEVTGHKFCEGSTSAGNVPNFVWRRAVIDVSAWAGQSVTVEFGMRNDGAAISNFLLDEVALLSGNGCIAPTTILGTPLAAAAGVDGELLPETDALPAQAPVPIIKPVTLP